MSTDPDQPPVRSAATAPLDVLNLVNAGYVADLYERYRSDPDSVDSGWRKLFDSGAAGFEPVTPRKAPGNKIVMGVPRGATRFVSKSKIIPLSANGANCKSPGQQPGYWCSVIAKR